MDTRITKSASGELTARSELEEARDQELDQNPRAIISMAIFDMDVYRPTREVLTAILPRLTKGLPVFDELSCPHFPGETTALAEVLGLNRLALRRDPNQPYGAWAVFGE